MQAKNNLKSNLVLKLKNLLYWINILLVIITLITYVSPFVSPSKAWQFSFLGLTYPYLLLGNFLFIILWLWMKDTYVFFSAGCILAGFGYFTSFFGLNCSGLEGESTDALSVMTYNVAGLRRYDEKSHEDQKHRRGLLQNLADKYEKVDILCVQEGSSNLVTETLRKTFGFTHYFKYKGTIIFSKYPFVRQDRLEFGKTTNSCIWADLKTPDGIVRVYSTHLQSNWLAATALKLMNEPDPSKKETWKGIRQLMLLYKRAAVKRSSQAELLSSHISDCPHPVILCGDFNDTPVSYVYHTFSKQLKDSFREKGCGLDFTYNGKIPGLRIDYVFSSNKFEVKSHDVPKLELSDHYPVFVRLELPGK